LLCHVPFIGDRGRSIETAAIEKMGMCAVILHQIGVQIPARIIPRNLELSSSFLYIQVFYNILCDMHASRSSNSNNRSMMNSLDFTVVRCPYCRYIWAKRADHMPVSCPRCKRRFDYPGNRVKLVHSDVSIDSDSTKKDWLTDANRHSLQLDSLDEILDKLEQQ